MIKRFYIFENSLYSSLNNIDFDEKDENLNTLIGFNSKDYKIDFDPTNHVDFKVDFSLSFKEGFLEKYLSLEEGILQWCLTVTSYYSNDYNVDDSELEYVSNYLTKSNRELLDRLLLMLDVVDEDLNLNSFFCSLGENLDKDDILYDISDIKEDAIKFNVQEELDTLPFRISEYSNDIVLEFNIEKIGEYIEKNKLEDINTIRDFIDNIDFSDIRYELEYEWSSNYKGDYSELNETFKKQIKKIINELKSSTIIKTDDPNQLSLFDDIELSKIKSKEKQYSFESEFFKKLDIRNLSDAQDVGGKIFAWFKSYLFQKQYMDTNHSSLDKFRYLKEHDILNPAIEYEYGYLEDADKYNL